MKYWILALAVLLAAILFANIREGFGVPEFLDRTQDENTVAHMGSSYAQTTNHLVPTRNYAPPTGMPTGYRVNLYQAYKS
jgi:hypothetical protein